jgi:hypothetical protein
VDESATGSVNLFSGKEGAVELPLLDPRSRGG